MAHANATPSGQPTADDEQDDRQQAHTQAGTRLPAVEDIMADREVEEVVARTFRSRNGEARVAAADLNAFRATLHNAGFDSRQLSRGELVSLLMQAKGYLRRTMSDLAAEQERLEENVEMMRTIAEKRSETRDSVAARLTELESMTGTTVRDDPPGGDA